MVRGTLCCRGAGVVARVGRRSGLGTELPGFPAESPSRPAGISACAFPVLAGARETSRVMRAGMPSVVAGFTTKALPVLPLRRGHGELGLTPFNLLAGLRPNACAARTRHRRDRHARHRTKLA